VLAGTTPTFPMPPTDAVSFRDDSESSRAEQFDGRVDALRISDIARSPAEIAATYAASRAIFADDFDAGCFMWSDWQGLICSE
jgi:hypothetical protein